MAGQTSRVRSQASKVDHGLSCPHVMSQMERADQMPPESRAATIKFKSGFEIGGWIESVEVRMIGITCGDG